MEMFNLVGTLAIIIATVIGIDFLIGKVFEKLLNYQDKREEKALSTVNKLLDKIPDIMMKTVGSIEEYIEQKNRSTFKEVDDEDLTI